MKEKALVGEAKDGQQQGSAMRVFPFINGEPEKSLTVPRMSDFYKICSISKCVFTCV